MNKDQENELGEHPRGTLALMVIMGVVFVLGWLAVYFFIYVPRGIVTR